MKVEVTVSLDLKVPLAEIGESKLRRHIKASLLAGGSRDNRGPFFRGISCGPVKEVHEYHDARVAGGKARAEGLTSEKRSEIASLAAKARWAKKKTKPKRVKLEEV